MDTSNLRKLSVQETKKINGGTFPSWAGYAAVIVGEAVDAVTSGGDNLRKAYQNGYEAGRS